MTNFFDPKHPHEPSIPVVEDDEGRCLVCGLIVARDDAIETGRQWETIARRYQRRAHQHTEDCTWTPGRCICGYDDLDAAFRDLADRTPTPTDGTS